MNTKCCSGHLLLQQHSNPITALQKCPCSTPPVETQTIINPDRPLREETSIKLSAKFSPQPFYQMIQLRSLRETVGEENPILSDHKLNNFDSPSACLQFRGGQLTGCHNDFDNVTEVAEQVK